MIGVFAFPGVPAVIDGSYTCSHGITPGTCTLTIPVPLEPIAEQGVLSWSDGVNPAISIRDCRVVNLQAVADSAGQRMIVVLQDRRWAWAYATPVSGRYNIPAEIPQTSALVPTPGNPLGNQLAPPVQPPPGEEAIRPETKKTALQLVELLLKALGERSYNTQGVPKDALPTVEWDAVNPARALQALCDDLGCRIVYRPDVDAIWICQRGSGFQLPDGSLLNESPGLANKVRPGVVRVYGSPTRYQYRFLLEPVGREFDGKWLPIDELSYKPTIGWDKCGPPMFPTGGFNQLPPGRTRQDAEAACREIYLHYRVRLVQTNEAGPLVLPFDKNAKDDERKANKVFYQRNLRILPVRNGSTVDDLNRPAQLPAACFGIHTPPSAMRVGNLLVAAAKDTDRTTEVKVPFTVDSEHNVITFSQYVYWFKPDNGGMFAPADIVLECAAEVADPNTHQWKRPYWDAPVIGGQKGTMVSIIRDEARYQITTTYKDGVNPVRSENNYDRLKKRVQYYALAEALKYQVPGIQTRTYAGLVGVFPDGAIEQVTWSVAPDVNHPQTVASRNGEHDFYRPPYAKRRQIEETDIESLRRAKALADNVRVDLGGK